MTKKEHSLGGVDTYENVAQYYANVPTGTIVIKIGNTPNIMLDAEIAVQGYNGIQKFQVRGYTYAAQPTWHQPVASCSHSGTNGTCTVRFATETSTGDRVILLGTPTTNWGSYPHVTVTRVSVGYGSGLGDWTISRATSDAAYSAIITPNMNDGFVAYDPIFTGNVNIATSTDASLTSTAHGLTIGNSASTNIAIDNNEIMARSNGAGATLYIQNGAGMGSTILNTSAGNVGIREGAPSATLDVGRGTASSGTARFQGTTRDSHFNFSTTENTYIRGGKATSNVLINDAGGNVGIGNGAPSQKLHVTGNSLVTGRTYIGSTDAYFYRDAANRIATPDYFYVQAASPATYLYSTNTYLGADSGDTTNLRASTFRWNQGIIEGNGDVGIGSTANPTAKLDVTGGIKASLGVKTTCIGNCF